MKNLENQLLNGVTAILGKGGVAESFGLIFHKEQYAYACSVAKGIARGGPDMGSMTLLEASTGTGKTIGYGVPYALYSAFSGKRVGVSTFTLHLQRQIMQKDMPIILDMVEKYTGKKLFAARRIGMRNFISKSRLENLIGEMDSLASCDPDELLLLDELVKFAAESLILNDASNKKNTGEFAEFLEDAGISALPCGITQDQICLGADCPKEEIAIIDAHKTDSMNADIVITSHAMTALHGRNKFNILDGDRPISAMVFDEADKFPDAAAGILGQRFPVSRVRAMLQKIKHPEFQKCSEDAMKLEAILKSMYSKTTTVINVDCEPASNLTKAMSNFSNSFKALLKISFNRKAGQKNIFKLDPIFREYLADFVLYNDRLLEIVRQFKGDGNSNDVMVCQVVFSPCRNYPTLAIIPVNPGIFMSQLWAVPFPKIDENGKVDEDFEPRVYLESCLMTSATLGDPGLSLELKFKAFMRECGIYEMRSPPKKISSKNNIPQDSSIDKVKVLQVNKDIFASFEPSVYGQIKFLLCDPRVPKPLLKTVNVVDLDVIEEDGEEISFTETTPNPEWVSYVSNTIFHAQKNLGGRTLVLTNSYRSSKFISDKLGELNLDNKISNLFVHEQSQKLNGLVEKFKLHDDAVLVTAGGWEGLSIVNAIGRGMIDNLIITQLPFGGRDIAKANAFAHLQAKIGKTKEEIRSYLYSQALSSARRKMMQGIGRGIRSYKDKCTVIITDSRFSHPLKKEVMIEFGERKEKSINGFHHCVPTRFLPALSAAKILRADGTVFIP